VPGLRSAAQAHRIEPADLAVTFFRAKERPDLADLSEAWRPLARGGVVVVEIAGGHFDLAGDGRAEALATAIADSVGRSVDE